MTGDADTVVKRGRAEIRDDGLEYAKEKAAANDGKLDAAKLEIEAGITDGTIVKVTAQDVLRRAGLGPHFLCKPARRNTNAALRIWLDQQNKRLLRTARRASAASDDKQAFAALRENFVRLQNAYAKDALTGIALSRELREERLKVTGLMKEIAGLRERLRSAGLPERL